MTTVMTSTSHIVSGRQQSTVLQSWSLLLLLSVLAYVYLMSILRYRRVKAMHRKFRYSTRESFSAMTVDDAHAIHHYLVYLEFPKVFSTATLFALFKVGSSLRPFTLYTFLKGWGLSS